MGPNRDGCSAETGLLKQWPEGGPKLAWRTREIGVGYAGPALVGDTLYILGDLADGCYVLALERTNGKLAWKTKLSEPGGNPTYPGPRATPTIDGNLLITETQHGDVICLDLTTRKVRWQKNLERDLQGERPMWHFGEAPLVDGDKVIATPGGDQGVLVAFDKQTGNLVWRSKDFTNDTQYSSVIAADIEGVRQYIKLTSHYVTGVDAATGKTLWQASRPGVKAIVPTPLYADNYVYVTSGYGVGCNLFNIAKSGSSFMATEVYKKPSIVNHHGGVIKRGDHLYGHSDTGGWTCQEFKTGNIVWQDKGVGKGSVFYADGHLYCRSETGPIALVEATPSGYKEKGRFNQPDRSKQRAWPHPVMAGGRLYIRDQGLLLCYQVTGQ
jgi:outer membrane protein assembly factor BamB